MSVISKLNELNPNISYTLSGHQLCPKCGSKNFGITKDDSLGLCFSASCRFRITNKDSQRIHEKEMKFLDRIFGVFKVNFLQNKGGNAYKYCRDERKIEPAVLEKSLIGEVCELPKELIDEVETLHALIQSNIEKIVKIKENKDEYKDDEEYKALYIRKIQTEKILDFFKNLPNYLGWLVTAYTDEELNIISLKFRKPYTKNRASLKPFKKLGVFGLNLTGGFLENNKNKKVVLTEGEFNVLQYFSCLFREGLENKAAPIISFGSATSPDIQTIQALKANVYLCRDNDEAGKACESKFAESKNFYSFTTPTKDLDEFLKPSNTNRNGSKQVKELIAGAEFVEMNFETSIEKVNRTRDGNNNKAHRKSQITTDFIIADLKEKGKFFKSLGRYFFLRYKDRLIYQILPKDEQLSKLLITFYKVNPSESIYNYIISELTNEAIILGKEAKTSFFTYYDKSDNSLFIYNFQDVVYQIKADGTVIKLKNGDKNILFLQTKNAKPFYIDLDKKYEYSPLNSLLFNEVFNKGNFKVSENGLSHREYAILLLYFFYTLLFMNKFNTRPIACLIGEKGSGKTTIGKMVGKVIYGESFNVSALPSKEDDFDALITNGAFHVLDNVDSTPDYLQDRLAVIATGGEIKKRQLYSNNTLCQIPIDCMLFITARTPRFTRDDIADRIIPFYFERLQGQGFLPESKMSADLLAIREDILSELIGLHIPFILKAIEEYGQSEYRATFRMAEFAEFSTLLSNKLGIKDEHSHIFKCLEKSQKEFALRDSPLFELLDIYISLKEHATQVNSTFEIFNILQAHLSYNGNKMPFSSAQQFTAHFSNNINTLKDDFKIEALKVRSNQTKYCISNLKDSGWQSMFTKEMNYMNGLKE